MPSEKVLEQKKGMVAELQETLKNACAGVLVDYKGINVADDTKLRKDLREAGVQYTVVKNTLLKFAADEVGYTEFGPLLNGTTALATSVDDPAKILSKYAEASKGKFSVKGGFVDGGFIDAAKVTELGNLPSKEQLLVQLLSVLNGNIRGLAVALNAIAEKNGAEAAPEAAAEAATEPAAE